MKSDKGYSIKQDYELSLENATGEITRELANVATANDSENQRRIGILVKNAAKLWLEVGQQRYRVFLLMSDSGRYPARSRSKYLESDGTLGLIVVPGLRRLGNVQGERLDKDEMVLDCKGDFFIFGTS
jgi:hypothetical protein